METIIGIPTSSGKEVATFPVSATKLALFRIHQNGNYTRLETLDMPEKDKAGFIASHCKVLLTNLANEEFLLDVLAFSVDVFCTKDKRADTAVANFLQGKATKLWGGGCCCGM